MIIQLAETSQLLITQPDHAALAAHLMRHWRAGGLPDSPRRSAILLAIEEHDNGWREVDAAPILDPATGGILDFINAPDVVRREVWPRGVARLAATPYAAALVAQHALHIYRRYRGNPAWAPFFLVMEAARDRHIHAAREPLDQLLRDYVFLRIGDLASLTFCNGWTDEQTDDVGYAVRFDGSRVLIAPDPFAGRRVPIEITARELPNRPFDSLADALAAFRAARTTTLSGIALGA